MTNTTPYITPRDQVLIDAGVPEALHPIYRAEAHYLGNMANQGRPSDAMRLAVSHGLDGLTSPIPTEALDWPPVWRPGHNAPG